MIRVDHRRARDGERRAGQALMVSGRRMPARPRAWRCDDCEEVEVGRGKLLMHERWAQLIAYRLRIGWGKPASDLALAQATLTTAARAPAESTTTGMTTTQERELHECMRLREGGAKVKSWVKG